MSLLTPGDLVVADATVDEADRIAAWNVAMALESEGVALDPAIAARGARRAFDRADTRYVVVRHGDTPIAQAMITLEWSDWRDAEVWWIQSVYVLPAWRGQGVYDVLHAHLRAQGRAAGAAGLRLYVDTRNARASRVYRRVGMTDGHYAVFEEMF